MAQSLVPQNLLPPFQDEPRMESIVLAVDYSNATGGFTSIVSASFAVRRPRVWAIATICGQANVSALAQFQIRVDGTIRARGATQMFGGSFRESLTLQVLQALPVGLHTFELWGRLNIAGTLFCRPVTEFASESCAISLIEGFAP